MISIPSDFGSRKKRPVLRNIAANASLTLAGLCIGIVTAELILRLWTPAIIGQSTFRGSHDTMHHALVPHSKGRLTNPEFSVNYRINGEGFRDDELMPKANDEFRIAVLGDSFTEGYGVEVESCYVQRLERSLNAEATGGRRFNVVNCGVVSYSPTLEVIQLRDRILQISPDLVLVAFDMTDLDDDKNYAQMVSFTSGGDPLAVSNAYLPARRWGIVPFGPVRTFVRDQSYVFALVDAGLNAVWPLPIPHERLAHTMEARLGQWHGDVDRSLHYLGTIVRICRDHGIPMGLIVYPYGHQVSSSEWSVGRKEYGIGPGRYDSFIFDELRLFAGREGIPYLDMTSTFRRAGVGPFYFPVDGHWTPRGHSVAADTLLEFLRGLTPAILPGPDPCHPAGA